VTVEQYQAFVKEDPVGDHAVNDRYSPDPKGPMNLVNWYQAAAYCNWLSRTEKLPECYEPNERGQYAEGMKIRADALRRNGYRLPTEAEWEYGCRAGTNTTRPYGTSLVLLRRYAWYISTSQDRAWHCGSLQPNDLGLFDMLGNVFEWCQDRYLPSRANGMSMINDSINVLEVLDAQKLRVLRGGSFPDRPAYIRSAERLGKEPWSRVTNAGFRPARTQP
jgi:formylglycine-generating enzyme required for sulfatase activity